MSGGRDKKKAITQTYKQTEKQLLSHESPMPGEGRSIKELEKISGIPPPLSFSRANQHHQPTLFSMICDHALKQKDIYYSWPKIINQ